jgi:hypothetical protein
MRRRIVKYRMHADSVIVGLDTHEHRLPYFPRSMLAVQRFHFPFQGLEKRFGAGEGPSSFPCGSCLGEPKGAVSRKAFAQYWTPVGMEQQALLSLPAGKGRLHIGAEGPADDFPVIKVFSPPSDTPSHPVSAGT